MKSPQEIKTLLEKVILRFSYFDGTGNRDQADCPLGAFNPKTDTDKFRLTLGEASGCPPLFKEHPEIPRELSLVNSISEFVSYSEGTLVQTWDGRTHEQPTTSVYHPEIDLALTLSVQGMR